MSGWMCRVEQHNAKADKLLWQPTTNDQARHIILFPACTRKHTHTCLLFNTHLAHEVLDHTVEAAALVAKASLTGAQRTEVLLLLLLLLLQEGRSNSKSNGQTAKCESERFNHH